METTLTKKLKDRFEVLLSEYQVLKKIHADITDKRREIGSKILKHKESNPESTWEEMKETLLEYIRSNFEMVCSARDLTDKAYRLDEIGFLLTLEQEADFTDEAKKLLNELKGIFQLHFVVIGNEVKLLPLISEALDVDINNTPTSKLEKLYNDGIKL